MCMASTFSTSNNEKVYKYFTVSIQVFKDTSIQTYKYSIDIPVYLYRILL